MMFLPISLSAAEFKYLFQYVSVITNSQPIKFVERNSMMCFTVVINRGLYRTTFVYWKRERIQSTSNPAFISNYMFNTL